MNNTAVDFFITLYQEPPEEWPLIQKVIESALNQQYPKNEIFGGDKIFTEVRVIYDAKTPPALFDYLKKEFRGYIHYLERPPSCRCWGDAWVWAYNNSKADFCCLSHADDLSFPNRVETQVRALLNHPTIAGSLAGWTRGTLGQPNPEVGYFDLHDYFNVGYPSGWCFSKKVLREFPPSRWAEFRMQDDVMHLYDVLETHPLLALREPLFFYNMHHGANFSPEIIKCNWEKYMAYSRSHVPHLKPLFTL